MEVVIQYFTGCPNWQTTLDHLCRLVEEGMEMSIDHEIVDSHESAVARGFPGSPTVLIDGVDPFADEDAPVGLACRFYRTEDGIAGSPSLAQLRSVVQRSGGG